MAEQKYGKKYLNGIYLTFFRDSIVIIILLVCRDVVYNYISSAVVGILRSLEGRTFSLSVPDAPRRNPAPDVSRLYSTHTLYSFCLSYSRNINDIIISYSQFSIY